MNSKILLENVLLSLVDIRIILLRIVTIDFKKLNNNIVFIIILSVIITLVRKNNNFNKVSLKEVNKEVKKTGISGIIKTRVKHN